MLQEKDSKILPALTIQCNSYPPDDVTLVNERTLTSQDAECKAPAAPEDPPPGGEGAAEIAEKGGESGSVKKETSAVQGESPQPAEGTKTK